MLTHISISSLTLVDRLELEFGHGMSVITGETGAGKSILLGALGLALGDRADSSLIAEGASKAEVSAHFDVSQHQEAIAWLAEREMSSEEGCILRRVVSVDGPSRAFINGSATTLAELKALSSMLLDIHAQHEHQSLLKKETHRRLLDEFGGLTIAGTNVAQRFEAMTNLKKTLQQTIDDAKAQSARVQLLRYQVEELTALDVREGEAAELETEQKRLGASEKILQSLTEVLALCDRELDHSASSQAARALRLLSAIPVDDAGLSTIREMIESAVIQLDEAMADLNASIDRFSADPARLKAVEDRLGDLYETARKHRVSPDELPALTLALQDELDRITNAEASIAELEEQCRLASKAYEIDAEKLTHARKKCARLLESAVTSQLQGLGMGGARFEILVSPGAPTANGVDQIEFLIATIPGNKPASLSKIASGGELSRISLAIQVTTAKTSRTPTLVFDEVDVGVGGATAEVIGSMLRQLGTDAQIICVTHLPQVAAQGHHHFVVNKQTHKRGAKTTVIRLGEVEKVDEIARMLGGIRKTDQSLAHAEAMISDARGSNTG